MNHWTVILQSPYYYFNISSLIPFFFSNLSFFIGLFVLITDKRSSFHRCIFYFYISAALWFLSYGLSLCAWVDTVAFFWGRVMYLSMVLISATLIHISLVATEHYRRKRFFAWTVYLGVGGLMWQAWEDPFFVGIQEYAWGFSPQAKDIQVIFLCFSFLCFFYAFLNIARFYFQFIQFPQRREADKPLRRKWQFMMAALVLSILSNLTAFNHYGISVFPLGLVMLFLSIVAMSYALVKYHDVVFLFRIRDAGERIREQKKKIEGLKLADMGKASIFASLSAGILHQMCQPITAIHGLSKFMYNSMPEDDPYFKSVDLIVSQSSYMKDMLNDLMDLIRHKEVKRENVNINLCLEKALRLLKDELRIKRIYWDFFPEENLPAVFADEVHLQETFMNIIVNAIQALSVLPRGEKRYFKINTYSEKPTNDVFIVFENNGPSLSDDSKENIFDPFISNHASGIGLGLALCKDLLVEHGGDITVKNFDGGSGQGVSFCVRFPGTTF